MSNMWKEVVSLMKHAPELLKMQKQLNIGIIPPNVDWEKIKEELDSEIVVLNESLSLSGKVCPTCGRSL